MNEARENNMLRRWLLEPIPTLDREEAVALLSATKAGVDERIDFNVMMLLATTHASLGLLLGKSPREGINVMLSTRTAVPCHLKDELTQVIRQARGDDEAVVRIHPLLEAREERPEASSISDTLTGTEKISG